MCDYMDTYSGLQFDPMNIASEHIRLEDIAHALSLLCRGGGHLSHFYSVGQHSVNCAGEAEARGWSKRVVLACLLHDASEAYISDIIRPVKKHLSNYLEIEGMIMQAVWEHFGLADLTAEEQESVRQIDDEILLYELDALLPGHQISALPDIKSVPELRECSFREIEERFIKMAEKFL